MKSARTDHTPDHLVGVQTHLYDLSLDWDDLAFANKTPIKDLHATFIAAPRHMSVGRFKQLIKEYLPQGNVIVGLAKEQYIDGFSGQIAFQTLRRQSIEDVVLMVNKASPKNKIYSLSYFQRDLPHLIEKLNFKQVILVRGSWHKMFHTSPAFYSLTKQQIPYVYVSPFSDETEARSYADQHDKTMQELPQPDGTYTTGQLLAMCRWAAEHSLDYTFQTGAVIAKKSGTKYKLLLWSYNQVLPFQTYAMHYGNSREDNFSPPNDLNHYDAIHAEMNLLVSASNQLLDLAGAALFINLLPCPTCARVLAKTPISEIYYNLGHSSDYAISLLTSTGKQVKLAA